MSTNRINGSDGVIIQSKKFLELPAGTVSERPTLSRVGMIRYNKDSSSIECVIQTNDNGSLLNEWKSVALLDASGKLHIALLPDSITSNTKYKGTWDATLNDIDISSGEDANIQPLPAPSTAGEYYAVRTAGSGNNANGLVPGEGPYAIGDWIISNGTVWEKISQSQVKVLGSSVEFSSTMLTTRNKHNLLNVNRVQQAIENLSEYALDRKNTDIITGDITFNSSRLILDAGTVLLPGLTFSGDLSTGISHTTSNQIDFSTNGIKRLSIKNDALHSTIQYSAIDGTQALPAYTFDSENSTGLYKDISGINFSIQGSNKATLTSTYFTTPVIQLSNGTASSPSLTFKLDTQTGLFNSGTYLGLSYQGTDVLDIFNTKIQTKKPIVALDSTITSPAYSFNSDNTTGIFGNATTVGVSIQGAEAISVGSTISVSKDINLKTNTLKWVSTNTSSIASDGNKIDFKSKDAIFNFGSTSENYLSIYNDALLIPVKGTVDTTPVSGMVRFNSTKFEGYISSEWVDLSSGGRLTTRGSTSSPSLYFSQDAIKNTGIYSPSEGSLGLVAGGVEQLRLISSKVTSYSPLELNYLSTTMTLTSDGTNLILSSSAGIKVTSKFQGTADIGLFDSGADTRKTYFRYTDGLIVEQNQTLAQKYLSLKGSADASTMDTVILDKTLNGIYQTNTDANAQSSAVIISASTTDYRYQLVGKLNGTAPIMRFRVGSGSTLSAWKDLVQNSGTDKFAVVNSSADSISSTGGITITGTLTQGSDARLKTNIQKLQNSREKLHKINGYSYSRLDLTDEFGPLKEIGVIAQEIQEIQPELIKVRSDGMLTVSYGNISALLIEATKDIDLDVQKLKDDNVALKNELSELNKKYDELFALIKNLQ